MSYKKQQLLTLRELLSSFPLFVCVAHHLVVCVVLLCVLTFLVPCCDVRYDFRIKTMFVSSLSPVVRMMDHVLFTLIVFVCVWWCFLLCFVCLRLSYPMLPIILWIVYCFIVPSVFSNVYLVTNISTYFRCTNRDYMFLSPKCYVL